MNLTRRNLLTTLTGSGAIMLMNKPSYGKTGSNYNKKNNSEIIVINSVAEIGLLSSNQLVHNQVFFLKSWHTEATNAESNKGFGFLIFQADRSKTEHDGGQAYSPTVPYKGSVVDYLSKVGETDIKNGKGCLVRVNDNRPSVLDFGARGADSEADTAAINRCFSVLEEVYIPSIEVDYHYDGILNVTKSIIGTLHRPRIKCKGFKIEKDIRMISIENISLVGDKNYNDQSKDDESVGLYIKAQHCKFKNILIEKFYLGVYVGGWSNYFNNLEIRICYASLDGRSGMENCQFDLLKSINCYRLPTFKNCWGILLNAPQFQNYKYKIEMFQSGIMMNTPYFETAKVRPSDGMVAIGTPHEISSSSLMMHSPIVNTEEPHIIINSNVRPVISMIGHASEKIQIISGWDNSLNALAWGSTISSSMKEVSRKIEYGGGKSMLTQKEMFSGSLVNIQKIELSAFVLKLDFKERDGFNFDNLKVEKRYYLHFDWRVTRTVRIVYSNGKEIVLKGCGELDKLERVKGVFEFYPLSDSGSVVFEKGSQELYMLQISESSTPSMFNRFCALTIDCIVNEGWDIGVNILIMGKKKKLMNYMYDGVKFRV